MALEIVRAATAALAATYIGLFGGGKSPTPDEVLTMRRPASGPFDRQCAAAQWLTDAVPVRFTAMVRSQSSFETVSIVANRAIPALFKTMST